MERNQPMLRALASTISVVLVATALSLHAPDAYASSVVLSAIGQSASWTGAALSGSYSGYVNPDGSNSATSPAAACRQTPPACDHFSVTAAVPSWGAAHGAIAVAIDWSDRNEELDLYLLDSAGTPVASSAIGGVTSDRVVLADPAPGTYTILVAAVDAVHLPYRGTVSLEPAPLPARITSTHGMEFSAEGLVDPQFAAAEPGLWVVPGGPVFVDTPSPTGSYVWRSDDGARTFRQLSARPAGVTDATRSPCAEPAGGGDSDLIADDTGQRVILADLNAVLGNTSVATAVSDDGGTAWSCSAAATSSPDDDRPWLVRALGADGTGPNPDAYLVYRTHALAGAFPGGTEVAPRSITIDVTHDGGQTWSTAGSIAPGALVAQVGSAFAVADGTGHGSLYVVFSGTDDAVYISRSLDEGRTFAAPVMVSQRPGWPSTIFVSGAADSDGNLYVAWTDAGAYNVLLSVSRDQGMRWSLPRQLNPEGTTAMMPWVAAGRGGDVAVAWYGTPSRVLPALAPSGQHWYAYVARSVSDGSRPDAPFAVSQMSDGTMHLGPICFTGMVATCSDPTGGGLFDFFKIAIGSDGAIIATFDDNGRGPVDATGAAPAPYVVAVRQTSGVGMTAAPPAGSALHATRDDVPASLQFTSSPDAVLTDDGLTLRMTLASGDLSGALAGGAGGSATHAGWLLVWRAGDRVEYAEMQLAAGRPAQFGGGTAPVPMTDAVTQATRFTYPMQVPLSGHADAGVVTVTIPRATLADVYGLHRGDRLRGLQAFSFTGTSTAATDEASAKSGTETTPPVVVVDSTEARTVTLAVPATAISRQGGADASAARDGTLAIALPDTSEDLNDRASKGAVAALLLLVATTHRRRVRKVR